jgi:hypothetical protein
MMEKWVAVLFSKDDPSRVGFPPDFPSLCEEFDSFEDAKAKYPTTREIMPVASYLEFKEAVDLKYDAELGKLLDPDPGMFSRMFSWWGKLFG